MAGGCQRSHAGRGRQQREADVDYPVPDKREGRIATTLFVVYPPGIATIVPDERLGAKPMLDGLKMFERSANLFAGIEVAVCSGKSRRMGGPAFAATS